MSDLFPLWVKIVFIFAAILGLFLLIKSISKMLALYNNPNRVEFSALLPSVNFEIKQIGMCEIAVKRPAFFGVIPTHLNLRLLNMNSNLEIAVHQSVNLFSQRNSMSGERIVPVSEFTVTETGSYQLQNLNPEKFKENDKLLITPKTGAQGFFLIFAIIFSAILFIGGTVFSVLSFVKLS